jgi:hypothetical protein
MLQIGSVTAQVAVTFAIARSSNQAQIFLTAWHRSDLWRRRKFNQRITPREPGLLVSVIELLASSKDSGAARWLALTRHWSERFAGSDTKSDLREVMVL